MRVLMVIGVVVFVFTGGVLFGMGVEHSVCEYPSDTILDLGWYHPDRAIVERDMVGQVATLRYRLRNPSVNTEGWYILQTLQADSLRVQLVPPHVYQLMAENKLWPVDGVTTEGE